MKKLIAIAFFAISFSSQAQTLLDTLIFNKVNEYRTENGLHSLKWSAPAQEVAKNQAEYCSRVKYVLHDQTDSSANDSVFRIEPIFEKRFTKFGISDTSKDWVFAENLLVNVDTSASHNKSYEDIASETIESWKKSPEHNRMMLIPEIEFASIAHVISDGYSVTQFDFDTMAEYTFTMEGKAYYIALDAYR